MKFITYVFACFFGAGFLHARQTPPDDMVKVEGGVYIPFYNSGTEEAEAQVETFYIDKYHVTNQDFLDFVTENPEWRKSMVKPIFADEGYLKHWEGDLNLGPDTGEIRNSPVTNISWFAARAYAKWKNKRLPTLDEWEFAASASEYEPVASRDSSFVRKVLTLYGQPQPEKLPPVGSGQPNYHGIYNLHGQVWEWVENFNTVFITGESRDGGGTNRQFYCAAGAAASPDTENYAAFIRFALRGSLEAHYTTKNLGFRLAQDVNNEIQ
ncbi:MAG: formylglycine-generating enzyme family protein [Balneolaceae bacterium]